MAFFSGLLALMRASIDVVKCKLLPLWYILDRKQGKIVYVLISVVTNTREDPHVGVT